MTPPDSGDYGTFMDRQMLAAAAGVGLPYAIATGDLTKANFAGQREGKLDFWRGARPVAVADAGAAGVPPGMAPRHARQRRRRHGLAPRDLLGRMDHAEAALGRPAEGREG